MCVCKVSLISVMSRVSISIVVTPSWRSRQKGKRHRGVEARCKSSNMKQTARINKRPSYKNKFQNRKLNYLANMRGVIFQAVPKKRLVSRINPSFLLNIILYNT